MNIILKGEPKSTSHIYKFSCFGGFPRMYMNSEGKSLKEDYGWQAKSQWPAAASADPMEIYVKLYFGTKRKADIDNFNKLLLDSLTGIVWVDDSQIIKSTTEKFYDKENPRIEIEIIPYGNRIHSRSSRQKATLQKRSTPRTISGVPDLL